MTKKTILTAQNLGLCDMQTSHLGQVLSIERQVQVMPWARLSFEQSLNRGDICRLVMSGQKVAAFHVCSAVMDEVHLLNIAVAAELQGIGLSHMLLDDIVANAKEMAAKKIFLEVRQSNTRAQSLYQKWQFEQIAIRKKYYRTPDTHREDALVYVRLL